MALEPGTRLGDYEILAPLGAARMDEVYRARDPMLKRDVAIKVLPSDWSRDADRVRRFELEAQAAAALDHSNAVSIFHVGDHHGSPYIVTELLRGETLRGRLQKGPIPLREVLDLFAGVTHGLSAAHAAKIVHRDLKPENVFLTNDRRVKILDFWLAKLHRTTEASMEGYWRHDPTAHHPRRRIGNGRLNVARAGAWRGGRRPQRHFCGRRHRLRDADQHTRLRQGDAGGHDERYPERRPAIAFAERPRPAAWHAENRHSMSGKESGAAFSARI